MANKPLKSSELAKFKFVCGHVIRATVDGVDYTFVPGEEYELPENDYLKSMKAQGYFETVTPAKETVVKAETI